MPSNDMGPAFGFILIAMMALLILNSITVNSNSALFSRAMKILDDSFSESIVQNEDISESHQNQMDNGQIFGSEDLSW